MSWADSSYYCSTRLNYRYYYCYSVRSSNSPAVGLSQRQRRSRSRAAAGHWRRFDCSTNAAFGCANLRSNALSHKLRRWRRRRSMVVNHKKTSREKLRKRRSNWKVENWRIEKVNKTETITKQKGEIATATNQTKLKIRVTKWNLPTEKKKNKEGRKN